MYTAKYLWLTSSFFYQALEDRVTVIQAAQLSFVDRDTPSQDLIYNITVPLLPEHGKY